MERQNNFDALRLVAAVSVIFSHAFLLSTGRQDGEPLMVVTHGQSILGLVGVFIFFVVSGYLVTQSFEQTGSPGRFLAKRALRIYPGLAVCLFLLAFGLGPLVTSFGTGEYFGSAGTYDFLVSNLLMDVEHNGLPGVRFTGFQVGDILDGPLWSLPCEVVMYLMVAVLGATRLIRLPMLGALLALGLLCLWFDTARSPYLIASVGWLLPFFAAGMILYKLRDRDVFDGRLAALAALGLAASVPGHAFVLLFPVFGGYLALYLARTPRLPVIPAARFGDLSYGLYIYGWPVEQALLYWRGLVPWWELFLIALPITAALAFLSWQVVEKAALRLKPRATSIAAPVLAPVEAA